MQRDQMVFEDTTFDRAIQLFVTSTDFRARFSKDAAEALLSAGIRLDPSQELALRRLDPPLGVTYMETFDERLVLCSSAGH